MTMRVEMMGGRALLAAGVLGLGLSGGAVVAQAADLGGNCCADLEERVAELEATTVRKGNRKVSLTVSGHVHEAIAFWDDGTESNTYIGSSNNSRSRFRFKGKASINSDWSAGFLMEFGVRRNDLSDVSQDNPRDTAGIDIRHEALYLKSKTYGSLWLGWSNSATQGITEIDLGGALIAEPDVDDWFGGFFLNFGTNATRQIRYKDLDRWGLNPGEGDRRNVLRYVSPSLAGFSLSAAWGGDDFWDVALRYAGEFGGIRVAAGIGYQQTTDADDAGADCETSGTNGSDVDCHSLGMSASILHTPTGLYLTGAYGHVRDDSVAAGLDDKDEFFYINAGIKTKLNSFGKTTFYGEYYSFEGGARSEAVDEIPGLTGDLGSSELDVYGFGVVQKIDAAAMELYVGYRHVEADVTDQNGNAASAEDFDIVHAGARIKF